MTARLTAHGVTVRPVPSGRAILEDASIEVHAGEIHALVGPNGAGKSTLFGVLAGDLEPESGRVELDGAALAGIRPRDLARRRAVLLQQNTVSFSFTAEQVVRMGRAPWARTPQEDDDDRAVAEAMAATEVLPLARRSVSSLSGGERARVGLARVLAQGWTCCCSTSRPRPWTSSTTRTSCASPGRRRMPARPSRSSCTT
ncbi:ATP-binding cassette domain-containing protein [Microbacterium sp. NIBRBAC000506063]|uniref:ATP-binding cassette domain-containing protein n=1 Tax=Microbacterium sp. NIBRBAC000506063 TaxID=2734618 RepID=UPI001CB7207E|nr:ATP-binding cassette domain-containing protein [Microbacterium sp. NIBRBAC000506063]